MSNDVRRTLGNSKMVSPISTPPNSVYDVDAVIVGAGFAGMYMLYRLRNQGLTVQILEAGDAVGGTWYWNRYPGARCDTESMFYSYQFSDDLQQEWEWTERYPRQPEILRYANHVADRFDLRRDIIFGARVISAKWHEKKQIWHIATSTHNQISAQFCIMATGCLSSPNIPDISGLNEFEGEMFHTGLWPDRHVDFSNKSVAILGTGSSGIQVIPEIAKEAEQLYVFQRTANYVVPAHNRPLNASEVSHIKENYSKLRAKAKQTYSGNIFETGGPSALAVSDDERSRVYEERWQMGGLCFMAAYEDLQVSPEANETAAQFIRNKIKEEVNDIDIAELLSPKNLFGCKRLCVASGYYETFNRKNVSLIDVSETPIDCITPDGVSVDSKEFKVDMIVLATGFDAMTGALKKIDITGISNLKLKEKWQDGPRTYLGLTTTGFPNFFTITGPGSPSVLTNMIPSVEQHVEWVSECISFMMSRGLKQIAANSLAENGWMKHVNDLAEQSLRSTCLSWYLGSNVPGKPRVFMPYIGGVPTYSEKCENVVADGYVGFEMN